MSRVGTERVDGFAVRRREITDRLDPHYYRPEFRELTASILKVHHMPLKEVVAQSSETWDQKHYRGAAAFPYIEISAVDTVSNDYEIERLPVEDAPSRAKMVVRGDDIIVSTTRPHRGAIARVRAEDDGAIASTGFCVLREMKTPSVSRDFLFEVLCSSLVLSQFLQRSSGGNYPAILPDDINRVMVPLSDGQDELAAQMRLARETRKRKLAQADELLAGMDAFLLDKLDLPHVAEHDRPVFAVTLTDVAGKRLDPPAYRPFFTKGKLPKTQARVLSALADIDPSVDTTQVGEQELVPYVGLPECTQTEIREVVMRPFYEVRGRSVFCTGDILFARIEPSVFNKKYVLADNLRGHEYAYTSTEFYVVRPRVDVVNPAYLYATLFCSFVHAQVRGKTTGSSGRRRIDPDMFESIRIPYPDRPLQDQIAKEVLQRRAEAKRLQTEADAEWQDARREFERRLLGKGA